METIFLKIFNMSVAATWMILAVVLIRFLMKKTKVPKWISCALWALVAVRLICPFSFESILSLIPSAEVITQETLFSPSPTIDTGVPIINEIVNPVMSESMAPVPAASVNPLQIQVFIAAWVWMIGLTVMLGYALFSYQRLYKKVKTSIKLQENVWICDEIDSPFILGVIKPKIYLPSNMESRWMGAVLNHENTHIKRHDHWWKPLGYLLLTIYWFNPLIWMAYILLCRDIEIACDERVVKDMDVQEKKDYSKALLSCSVSRKMIAACPLAFGEIGVKERIKSVLRYKKPAFWILVVSIIICVVIGICFLTNPKDTTGLDIETVNEMISQSSGWTEVDTFALDDSVDGYVFAGYTSEKRTGIAYFRFDENRQEYVLDGYQENYREYPFAITLGEEIGLEHSVTIAVSELKNVAFIQMEYEEEIQEIGVSVSPAMVSYEWDVSINEDQKQNVLVRFYDEGKHELSLERSMVPYEQNADGTWSADGYIYKYRLELTGRLPTAAIDSTYTVLTNNLEVTFEEVAWSMFSSNSEDWLDIEETRIVDLGTNLSVEKPEFRSLDEVKQLLAAYPDDFDELIKSECYVVVHGDSYSGEEYWDTFYQNVGSETPAEVVIVQFTIEGDAIFDYLQYNGESFYHVHDSTRDAFGGSQDPYIEKEIPYVKVFEPIEENGDICRYVYLTTKEDLTLDYVFESYADSSRTADPTFEHLLFAVLGNTNTGVCEVLDSENEATAYAEPEIPIEEISKIEVINGNNGRSVILESDAQDFQQVLDAYYNLEYTPVESPEESDRRIGYLYRLCIYDQDGIIAQNIIPYSDLIKMNGEIYDASMNRTAADLIAQLELLF